MLQQQLHPTDHHTFINAQPGQCPYSQINPHYCNSTCHLTAGFQQPTNCPSTSNCPPTSNCPQAVQQDTTPACPQTENTCPVYPPERAYEVCPNPQLKPPLNSTSEWIKCLVCVLCVFIVVMILAYLFAGFAYWENWAQGSKTTTRGAGEIFNNQPIPEKEERIMVLRPTEKKKIFVPTEEINKEYIDDNYVYTYV